MANFMTALPTNCNMNWYRRLRRFISRRKLVKVRSSRVSSWFIDKKKLWLVEWPRSGSIRMCLFNPTVSGMFAVQMNGWTHNSTGVSSKKRAEQKECSGGEQRRDFVLTAWQRHNVCAAVDLKVAPRCYEMCIAAVFCSEIGADGSIFTWTQSRIDPKAWCKV